MSGGRTHQRTIPQINWEERAVAREIMSGIAVQETKERLEHFLESTRFLRQSPQHHNMYYQTRLVWVIASLRVPVKGVVPCLLVRRRIETRVAV